MRCVSRSVKFFMKKVPNAAVSTKMLLKISSNNLVCTECMKIAPKKKPLIDNA